MPESNAHMCRSFCVEPEEVGVRGNQNPSRSGRERKLCEIIGAGQTCIRCRGHVNGSTAKAGSDTG